MYTKEDTFTFFWNGPFSNWDPSEFIYKGYDFANSEQAFMWEKANHFKDEEKAEECLKESNPREVKKIGRTIKGFQPKEWDFVKFHYMYEINIAKYTQSEKHFEFLKETVDTCLVEASPFDNSWGIGLDEKDAKQTDFNQWPGDNLLGKVLDLVRKELM